MNKALAAGLLAFFSTGLLASATATRADSAAPVSPAEKPALAVDRSPLGENKGPTVASYADVIEPAQKAVVSVYSTKFIRERIPLNPFFRPSTQDPFSERDYKEQGLGSGVIVSPNGFILTNHHVVAGADELSVALPDGREFKARIVGTDPKTDVAVVKIEAEGLPVLTLADSDKLRVGDIVFAVGNPLGIGQTVTMGIVSAKGRNSLGLIEGGYEDFIQTDAAINLGNSGGALIDAKGRLIGINSAIVSTTHGNIGIGLAIPVNLAATVMHSLVETGSVTRGYLGISVDPITPDLARTLGLNADSRAVVVTQVASNSPAEKAGIKRADVLLSIDGKTITSVQDLRLLVAQIPPDTEITAQLMREGKDLTVKARLGRLASDSQLNELLPGVLATRLNEEIRRRINLPNQMEGLLISSVDARSAYASRLAPEMIVLEINRKAVTDLESARAALLPGRNLLLVYVRGIFRYLVITKEAR